MKIANLFPLLYFFLLVWDIIARLAARCGALRVVDILTDEKMYGPKWSSC
jgi:hypothetical protein